MSRIPVLKAREDVIRLKGKKIIFQLNLQKHQALDLKTLRGREGNVFCILDGEFANEFCEPIPCLPWKKI